MFIDKISRVFRNYWQVQLAFWILMNLDSLMTAIGLLLVYHRVPFNWHEKSIKAEIFYFDEESEGLRKSEFQAQLGVSLRIYKTSI